MSRAFLKMHGLGNDFVVIDARRAAYAPSAEEVRAISDRRTGVGCDQFIIVEAAKRPDADAFMRIFNADGGEVGACGNASRCVGRLLMDESGAQTAAFETVAGLLQATRADDGLVTVDMGPARLDWRDVPLAEAVDTLSLESVAHAGYAAPTAVGMGNPHAVFFVDDAEAVPLADIGPTFEHHPMFPERTNVEFAHLAGPDRLRMRVWERGVGITQACGTGACAAAVAAMRRGLTGRAADVALDGGTLRIHWRESDGHVLMTGPATIAYSGVLSDDLSPS
jgi:diaminopimelate epimerase